MSKQSKAPKTEPEHDRVDDDVYDEEAHHASMDKINYALKDIVDDLVLSGDHDITDVIFFLTQHAGNLSAQIEMPKGDLLEMTCDGYDAVHQMLGENENNEELCDTCAKKAVIAGEKTLQFLEAADREDEEREHAMTAPPKPKTFKN